MRLVSQRRQHTCTAEFGHSAIMLSWWNGVHNVFFADRRTLLYIPLKIFP